MDTSSAKAPAEVSVKLKKKRRRRGKMKANNGHAIRSMDQKDENMDDVESGKSCMVAKDCLQDNLLEGDSVTKLSLEHPKADMVLTTKPLEKSVKPKTKRKKRVKKKAERKHEPQSMDHTNIISNLRLEDVSDGRAGGKINNISCASKESRHSVGKGSIISVSSASANLAQKDGKLVELCRKNHTASSPSLFDISSHSIQPQLLQERVELGLGICSKETKEHRSSEVIKEAGYFLLRDPYQIPQRRKFIRSRRKLLILDINGLLADIVRPPPRECEADINISGRAIFKRPFYYDFLKFCFERFDVGIWSSRSKRIIDKVVDYLLGHLKHKLLFCWDMFYCTETSFRTLDNIHKPMVLKELRKLWEKHDPNLPWEKGDYDESNTLLLDDSPYKALLNPMHTGVFPCSYSYKNRSDNMLGPGGDLRAYLEGLATAENVQTYVAQHPFGQGAINETNPYWSFYSGVLQSFFIEFDKRDKQVRAMQ